MGYNELHSLSAMIVPRSLIIIFHPHPILVYHHLRLTNTVMVGLYPARGILAFVHSFVCCPLMANFFIFVREIEESAEF